MTRILLLGSLFLGILVIGGVGGALLYKSLTASSTSDHALTVEKIEKMGKLQLVKINIKDVLEQTKERPLFLPNAKAVLIVVGEVYAGIDLQKIQASDIVSTEKLVSITLPQPEILTAKVNHEQSRVYDVRWGILSTARLVDEAYKSAEIAIREEAVKMGFEESCKTNAVAMLTPMFREIAGKDVRVLFRP
jgi:hypothetical protein